MDPQKQQYIDAIRRNTSYPTYRGIIEVIVILGYLLAAFYALGALIAGFSSMMNSFLTGLGILILGAIFSALVFVGTRFLREAALILADIGDSVTETNSLAKIDQNSGE